MNRVIETRRGLFAWIARRFELMCVNATLRWAERDHRHFTDQAHALPSVVRHLEHDLQLLRVRQAELRNQLN